MERKLASIQRIKSVEPIVGADAIVRATVLGWNVVVKKSEYKAGDPCVYVEVDSVLPERPEFEFLRARHFRIKTIKLRGQISQGICFSLSILPSGASAEEGADVTELLGIRQYIAPVPANLSGAVKGGFPGFLQKTDEMRIQAVPEVLERRRGKLFYVTEKLDGSSMTVYWKDGAFGVCSRNFELLESDRNAFWKAARFLDLEGRLRGLGRNLALQGELIGNGVQGNLYRLQNLDIRLFSIFDIDARRFLDFSEFQETAEKLSLETVPVVERELRLEHSVQQLVEMAKGQSLMNEDALREGLVFRTLTEDQDPEIGRLSFKVLNPDFLLAHDE